MKAAINLNRYVRQTILSEIGPEGQKRLSSSRVLCVGAGGLGSPVVLYLAAAGVGKVGLIDSDRVDLSNLQRQVLFHDLDQGRPKVAAAQEHLESLNPEITIETFNERFTDENAERLLNSFDLVIDGSDNFETKFLINNAAYKRGIPWVYGAVNRFEGQVAFFWGNKGSCYRCLYASTPKAKIQNCAENGVLGSVVGVIGTMQATLALQYLISGNNPKHPLFPKIGDLTILDLAGKWDISTVSIPKQAGCMTCSRPPSEITLQYLPSHCEQVNRITAQDLITKLNTHMSNLTLIDVRTTEEWNTGHIRGAIHWPLDLIKKGELPSILKENTIVTYCKAGVRSAKAAELLSEAIKNPVLSLSGGIDSWPEPLSFSS